MSLMLGATSTFADAIPYPTTGFENPVTYTFTATTSGHIIAYYAGSTASYENQLGMLINGTLSPSGYGLDNQLGLLLGTAFDLGAVSIGDSLVFVLHNVSPYGINAYSDPSLNGPYDGGTGHNHVYSTPYTQTSPIIDSIPSGTYVSFEDLAAFDSPDWNYHDENFVFSNVSVVASPDAASTLLLLAGGFGIIALARSRFLGRSLAV